MNFHRSYFLSGETIFLWKHCSQYSINRVCALLLNVSPLAHTCAYYDLVMRKHKKWPHHDWIFFQQVRKGDSSSTLSTKRKSSRSVATGSYHKLDVFLADLSKDCQWPLSITILHEPVTTQTGQFEPEKFHLKACVVVITIKVVYYD